MIPGRSGGGLLAGHVLEDPQAGFGSRHLVFQEALQHLSLLHFLLGVLHGLEIVPTAAWDRRLGRTTNEDDLIGVTEAAGALEVTPQAVRERLAAGTLPGRKIGRNWVLPASAPHR